MKPFMVVHLSLITGLVAILCVTVTYSRKVVTEAEEVNERTNLFKRDNEVDKATLAHRLITKEREKFEEDATKEIRLLRMQVETLKGKKSDSLRSLTNPESRNLFQAFMIDF